MNSNDSQSTIRFWRNNKLEHQIDVSPKFFQPFEVRKRGRLVISGDINGNIQIGTPGYSGEHMTDTVQNTDIPDNLAKYPCTTVYWLMLVGLIGLVGSGFNPWVLLCASFLIHVISETEGLKTGQAIKLLRDITVRGHFNVVAYVMSCKA